MLSISSPQNPKIKELVELRKDGNLRRAKGCFLVEGRKAVEAAMEAAGGEAVVELIVSPNLLGEDAAARYEEWARERGRPVLRVSKDCFRKIADVREPQGVAAVARIRRTPLGGILGAPGAISVVACGIQDPGNLGTLLRSAYAAGASGLIALEGCADLYNAKVVRSTAASLLFLPSATARAEEFLAEARARGIRIAGASSAGGERFDRFDYSPPLALCIGSEGSGLPPEIATACSALVTIPMREGAESLNAAVAGSIILFQAMLARWPCS
ncbi:MAG: RNA methyltransferase [Planctomycetota bacterium]|nr:RNA methyltransferase [Planctomycetota bacterium]